MGAVNSVIINYSDKFIEYMYTVSEFYIIINEDVEEIPVERVTDFKIEHYFDEASFPIFKISCIMEPSKYYNIIKNKENVKFKLRIQSCYKTRGNSDRSMLIDVINDTFAFFPEDGSEDLEKDLKREANTLDDTNKLEKLNNIVDLFLFKDSFVTNLRSSFNTVLNNVNLSTAVTYLLSKAGIKNVLMSPFENNEIYKTLVLPPQSIEKQIRYLNNNYGFHKKGTMVYFGLFHGYIINYDAKCTAWANNEWTETVIFVLEKSNNLSYLSGALLKRGEERNYYIAKTEGVSINNSSIVNNVLNGTDATAIDMKNSDTKTTKAQNAKTIGKSNSAILFNSSSNKYMSETFAAQQSANGTIITISLENIKLEAFNPNKLFSFVFENAEYNSKYKGVYKISTAIYNFTKSGEEFIMNASLVFKKVG